VKAVVDSSVLISLAWAGLLDLLRDSPLDLVVPTEVYGETVLQGLARGHADAAAIEDAVLPLASQVTGVTDNVDAAVLRLGVDAGLLLTNDLALGRRAANLGVGWLRTADLVVLCVRRGRIDRRQGRAGLRALHHAGRITGELLEVYDEELR
jgi:predicted nucleic acid-binding protein